MHKMDVNLKPIFIQGHSSLSMVDKAAFKKDSLRI